MGEEIVVLERSAGAASRLHAGTETHAPWVWVNGDLVRSDELRVHYFSHALHYGSGVFEGIRAYETERGPAIFRLREHMDRFLRSAACYRLEVPHDAAALGRAAVETVRRNGVRNGYIRPLAFFGEGPIHLTPNLRCPTEVLIAVRALGAYLGDEGVARGVKVIVSTWRKFDRTMLPPTVKGSGHYMNSILAAQEAAEKGAAEAILLNADGTVAEATGENVFFVKDGTLFTNDESSNILPGITRDSVLALARDAGVPIAVRAFRPEDLLAADEVFMTGTAAEVTPVAAIDDRMLPPRPDDGITARLQRAHFHAVRGEDPRHADWLTHV
ncbi:MAG: branched-chain amino acid transaminase [Candidatus Polarisedimenticolia bacterium]